jgi:MFS family permease
MGMFIGATTIVVGVIIQICTIANPSVGQFMAGRFFLGFGVAIAAAAGPVYVIEISHPAHRGIVTGLYNVMWPVGALVASGAARGGLDYVGNTSWLIPVGLQLMFPSIVMFGSLLLPESPRWTYTRGQRDKATDTLIALHGRGNRDSEWVKLQLSEYEQHLEMDGTDKKWWDYRALFRNKASMYRLMCNCVVSLFGQWAGNSNLHQELTFRGSAG